MGEGGTRMAGDERVAKFFPALNNIINLSYCTMCMYTSEGK